MNRKKGEQTSPLRYDGNMGIQKGASSRTSPMMCNWFMRFANVPVAMR